MLWWYKILDLKVVKLMAKVNKIKKMFNKKSLWNNPCSTR